MAFLAFFTFFGLLVSLDMVRIEAIGGGGGGEIVKSVLFVLRPERYKKQVCVLYRLGYELAKNKKQSPLFAFCKAVRTGISQKQKQKELFVFAKKSRKDRPKKRKKDYPRNIISRNIILVL